MTDDLTHYMEATSRLSADLTAAQQEIERLRDRYDACKRVQIKVLEQYESEQARAETAEAERDKARHDLAVKTGEAKALWKGHARLIAEKDRLQEALADLERYGPHDD